MPGIPELSKGRWTMSCNELKNMKTDRDLPRKLIGKKTRKTIRVIENTSLRSLT